MGGPFHGFGIRHIQVLGHLILLSLTYACDLLLHFVNVKASHGEYILKFPDDDVTVQKLRAISGAMTNTEMIYSTLISTFARVSAGYLCLKIDNKYLVIATVAGQILIFSLLIPCTRLFGYDGYRSILFILQFPQAFQYPIALSVYSSWLPPDDLLFCLGMMYLVQPSTFFLVMVVSIKLAAYGSLYVFYSVPILLALWLLLYVFGGAGSPHRCFYLSSQEKSFLEKTVLSQRRISWRSRVPVSQLLRINLLPMYICLEMAMDSSNRTFNRVVVAVEKGHYVLDLWHYIVIILAAPFIIYATSKLISILLKSEHLTKSKARKYCNTLGVWGLALCCLLNGYCGLARNIKNVDMVSKFTTPFYFMGCFASFYDVVPDYVPFIYSLTNAPAVIIANIFETFYWSLASQAAITMSLSLLLLMDAGILYLVNMWFLFTTIERKNVDTDESAPDVQ